MTARRRSPLTLLLALLAVGVMTGCAGTPVDPAPDRIGASFLDIDERTEMIQRGVLLNARPPETTARWNSAGKSAEKQRRDIDEFLAQSVDALILQPADAAVLAYAREQTARRGTVLVWIREASLGAFAPPADLPRIETDWLAGLEQVVSNQPGTPATVITSTRPAERAGVADALGVACGNSAECVAPAGALNQPQPAHRLALDEESFDRLLAAADSSGTVTGLASESCARALIAGTAAGCLDTRPYAIGQAALEVAQDLLARCPVSKPESDGQPAFFRASTPVPLENRPPRCAETGTDSLFPGGSGSTVNSLFPGGSGSTVNSLSLWERVRVRGPRLEPAPVVAIGPDLILPAEAAELTYRWPDLPLLPGAAKDQVVGDGYR